jgi:hypothetical protein
VDHLLHHLLAHLFVNDMDQKKLVRHLCAVGNFQFPHLHLLVVVHRDVLQNLDEQNLVVHLPYLDVAHQLNLLVVAVDVALLHQLKTDYFLDVVDVEQHFQLRMDYFLDVVRQVLVLVPQELLVLLLLQSLQLLLHLLQLFLHRVMLSAPLDLHRALLQVQLQVQG